MVKTTFADAQIPGRCEARDSKTISHTSEMGRSRVKLECPFCGAWVTAFLWSLSGSGKRCTCGAIARATGRFFRVKEVNNGTS